MLKLDDDATVFFSHVADWTATSIARELEPMTPPRNHGKLTEAEFAIEKRRLLNDDARKASHRVRPDGLHPRCDLGQITRC